MKPHRGFLPHDTFEALQYLAKEWHNVIFKHLCTDTIHLDLLLHLWRLNVFVKVNELIDQHYHSLIVGDLGPHHLRQFFNSLVQSVALTELRQDTDQLLLELLGVHSGADSLDHTCRGVKQALLLSPVVAPVACLIGAICEPTTILLRRRWRDLNRDTRVTYPSPVASLSRV